MIRINGHLTVPRLCKILRKFSDECEKIYLSTIGDDANFVESVLLEERELDRKPGSGAHLVGGGAVTALIYFCEKIVYNLNFTK